MNILKTCLAVSGTIIIELIIIFLFFGCFSPGSYEQTVIYGRLDKIPPGAEKITPRTDTSQPVLINESWASPVPLSDTINSAGLEDSPFILPEGDELYFFYTPDAKIPPEKQLTDGVTGIYYSEKHNDEWSEPVRISLQEKGKLSLDGCQFINGNIMWFCSAREGNFRDIDIYKAELKNGNWSNWENAGKLLNVEYEIGELHLTSDGKELYFHSDRSGGRGGLDIWVTENTDGNWQEPRNLKDINSEESEGWPFISQDKQELWFTRTYKGTPAIFRSIKLNDGTWSEPELILYQFAGEPSLDKYGNIYFVHHYYHDKIMLESDIYIAPLSVKSN
jgi:hypothetical protein